MSQPDNAAASISNDKYSAMNIDLYTLDYIDAISANPSDANNELITLQSLRAGLLALAREVHELEKPFQTKRISFFGFGLGLPPGKEELIPCYFHWFGNSLCNYARLVGFFGGLSQQKFSRASLHNISKFKDISSHCKTYVESIPELAPVLEWRNKVYAHFAMTDPRKSDSAALLDFSVMSPIGMENSRFCVGNFVAAMQGGEAHLPQWSLTETFNKLAPRYWPDLKIDS